MNRSSLSRYLPGNCGKLLIISQVYVPDPAAVGQQIADTAEEMARRGWDVHVLTSNRGYDDPTIRYSRREVRNGVQVRRLPLSSFGKRSIAIRLVAQASFMAQAVLRGLLVPGLTNVLVSTSPPFAGIGGRILGLVRRVPYVWWVMDINPDQMIRSGRIGHDSVFAKVFRWLNRQTVKGASAVIVLDRFMRRTLEAQADLGDKVIVSPPWAYDNILEDVPRETNPFRHRHGLDSHVVIMYSGNAGYSTPLATLLAAAKRLEHDQRLKFVFIGGGVLKKEIDAMVAQENPPNVLTLPYQPLSDLRFSLSAADVHVVSIADEAVGVIHPCKIYGALAVGRPVIALATRESYIGDLITDECGWVVSHGSVDELVTLLQHIAVMPCGERSRLGDSARSVAACNYSRARLLDVMCTTIEDASTKCCQAARSA